MAEAGNAIFRAIADFARARREAKNLAGDLRKIRDEAEGAQRALNDLEGEAGQAGGALKNVADAAQRTKQATGGAADAVDDLGDAAGRANRQTSGLGREVLATAAKVTILHRAVDGLNRALRSAAATTFAMRIRSAGRAAQDAYDNLQYFRRAVDQTNESSKRMIGSLLRMIAVLAAVSVATSALTAGTGGLLSLAAAAASLAGVAGLLPGVLGLFGAGLAAVIIGTQGFGDALKAITSGDAVAFEESLKNLTPAAQDTARAIWDMRPAFAAIKTSVQEALFKDLAPIVRNLGERFLPTLNTTLTSVAGSLNKAARQVGAFLLEGTRARDVDSVFASIARTADNLVPVAKNLTSVLLDFAVVGSELMEGYATEIANASGRFRDFIREARESGRLKEWIEGGVESLKTLGSIVGNVGSVLYSAFKAGKDAGYSFLQTVDQATERLARFFKSTEGQTALAGFFKAVAIAGKAIVPVIEEILLVIGKVAPILADLGARIAPGLADAIHGIGVAFETAQPGLALLADAVGRFLSAVGNSGPLVGALANGVAAVLVPAITVLAAGLEAITGLFNALPGPVQALIGGLGGLVVVGGATFLLIGKLITYGRTLYQTFVALRTIAAALGLTSLITGLRTAAVAMLTLIGRAGAAALALGRVVAAAVLTGLTSVAIAIRAVSLALLTMTVRAGAAALAMGRVVAVSIIAGLTSLVTTLGVVTRALWLMTAAALANPIVLIATAIALVAFLIITNWSTLKAWFGAFWTWLTDTASTAGTAVKDFVTQKWTELLANTIRDWIAIGSAVGGAWDWVITKSSQAGTAVKDFVTQKWSELLANTARDWIAIGSAVGGAWDWVKNTTREAGDVVQATMLNAWQRARDAVVSKGEEIGGFVASLPGRIRGWLGDLGSLLYDAGRAVVQGFINGITSAISGAAAAAARLGKAALDAAKAAIGYGSPSRLAATIGEAFSEGFARGILTQRDRVVAAVQRVAGAAGDVLRSEVEDLARQWVGFASRITQARARPAAVGGTGAPVRALQDRLGSPDALRTQLAGLRVPDVDVASMRAQARDAGEKTINVVFNVTNPLPEPASDTAARKLRTLAQMGALE